MVNWLNVICDIVQQGFFFFCLRIINKVVLQHCRYFIFISAWKPRVGPPCITGIWLWTQIWWFQLIQSCFQKTSSVTGTELSEQDPLHTGEPPLEPPSLGILDLVGDIQKPFERSLKFFFENLPWMYLKLINVYTNMTEYLFFDYYRRWSVGQQAGYPCYVEQNPTLRDFRAPSRPCCLLGWGPS